MAAVTVTASPAAICSTSRQPVHVLNDLYPERAL